MPRIKVLPPNISNRIAAGEVVERPASVVKELIENSIDAGADRIVVETIDGGRKLIRITDNGCGMSQKDLELSVERHATSKITSENDLDAIISMGFRGEALASIASVSRLVLLSRTPEQEGAWQIAVNFGEKDNLRPAAFGQQGTRISVEDLFLEIPARRKFLKTKATENAHIAAIVRLYASSLSSVRFELYSEGELVLKSSKCPQENPLCLTPLLGADKAARLFSFHKKQAGMSVTGHLSRTEDAHRTIKNLYFFINKRPVKSPVIQRAVMDAFKERLTSDRFPCGGLFLTLPPDEVDVNVHPAKLEVRFERPDEVFRLVYQAVRSGIEQQSQLIDNINQVYAPLKQSDFQPIRQATLTNPGKTDGAANAYEVKLPENWQNGQCVISEQRLPWENQGNETKESLFLTESLNDAESLENTDLLPDTGVNNRIVGQIKASYILIENRTGIVLMDQHAAHEAFLYKTLCQRIEGMQEVASQPLLFPVLVDLEPEDTEKIAPKTDILRQIGFDIEPFGANQVIVRATPVFLDEQPEGIKKIIENAVQGLRHCDLTGVWRVELPEGIRRVIAGLACHGAIKMNRRLDYAEMEELVRLVKSEKLTNCPHGRPIFTVLTYQELEKRLGRH